MTIYKDICGLVFSDLGLDSTVSHLAAQLDSRGRPRFFACVNPHSVEIARRDTEFAAALRGCDLITPDGIGIVVASRILGGCIRERVCGPDLFQMLCAKLNRERPGTRMFFLAASDDTSRALVERFQRDFPRLVVAGTFVPTTNPIFTPEEDEAMINAVNSANPEVLWVGLGQPRQEKLTHRLRDRLNVRLIGPVGAVFDFYTGRVKLPPLWVQQLGLIWLYRLCQEPRRLLRRNLDSPVFLARVLMQRLRKR